MYLCHKCSGLLLNEETENVSGLLGCSCISGYYRGFEPLLNRAQAIERQIKQQDSWIESYIRQGCSQNEIGYVRAKKENLKNLKNLK